MSYNPKVVKHGKLKMISPVQDTDHRGGTVSDVKSPKLSGSSGKGTQSKFKMEGPDLTGGGWSKGGK